MIKPIKFDLKLNDGETLRTLDDLKNNLSPELFEHFQSGKLAKWLRVRKLQEQANAVEKLLAEIHDREVQSFKGLIELFGGEADVDSLRTMIAERKKMLPSGKNVDDEIEQLKNENSFLQSKIEKYESCHNELTKVFKEFFDVFDTAKKSLVTFNLFTDATELVPLEIKIKSKLEDLKITLGKTMNSTD